MPRRMLGEYIGPGTSKYTDYDAVVTERCCEWLAQRTERDDDQPWCLYVGLVAPHFPLVVPQEFYDMYPLDQLPDVILHPSTGYARHPWLEKQNSGMESENNFHDAEERLRAMAVYCGLCSWLDDNFGPIMAALDAVGLGADTTVIYTSDHGDNVGARGLWGKSNLYQESVAVPMIMAGPGVAQGTCNTPISLLDVSATIPAQFGVPFDGDGQSLATIATATPNPDREILSRYHAAGPFRARS